MPRDAEIADNLDRVRRRVDAAAHRAHRDPAHVTLIAVSKTFGPDLIRAAAASGQRAFGENRVQEAEAKISALADLGLEWHLIGHLQSNKAKKAATAFAWVQSVDTLSLLQKLDREGATAGRRLAVLLQVDLALETTKHGASEDTVFALAEAAAACPALDLQGLMIVPPYPDNPEDSRPWFRRLRELRDTLVGRGVPPARMRHLSMGMSHDFEVAVEEGATMVRVGTAIFGPRPATAALAAGEDA